MDSRANPDSSKNSGAAPANRRGFLRAAAAVWLGGAASAFAAPASQPVETGRVKRTSFVRRRFDLDHAQFVDHWRNIHAKMVATTSGLERYVGAMVDLTRAPNSPFDGVAQLWFPSPAAAAASVANPANAPMRVLSGPDAWTFMTMPVYQMTAKEYVVTPADPGRPPAKVKEIVLLKKAAKLSDEQFADYWLNTHARTSAGLPGLREQRVNLIDRESSPPNPVWDGYAELWFDDFAAYDAAHKPSPLWDTLVKQRTEFTTPDARVTLATEEIVVPLNPV